MNVLEIIMHHYAIIQQLQYLFVTVGAYQPSAMGSCRTSYLSKFNFNGQRLWSTYFKNLYSIKASENSVFVTTNSSYISNPNLVTAGTFQQNSDESSIFFGKFDDFGQPVWGTYAGLVAELNDNYYANIEVDNLGNPYLFGKTACRSNIATTDAFLTVIPIPTYYYSSGFAMKFNTSGQRLWGTYYGGDNDTQITSLNVSGTGFYISGFTACESNIATQGSLLSTFVEPPGPEYDTGNSFLVRFDTNQLATNENELESISLFPNQNQGSFRISNLENNSTVAVFDAVGKKLYESPVLNNAEINLKNVSKGIYFVKVKSGGKVYKTEKMIVN